MFPQAPQLTKYLYGGKESFEQSYVDRNFKLNACERQLSDLILNLAFKDRHETMKNLTGITLGDQIENFGCETSQGPMTMHSYFGEGWGMLCSHPDDYTPVCTTELGELARLDNAGEFSKRNMKVMALSCNDVESHKGWMEDIKAFSGEEVKYPIIADQKRTVAASLGMLSQDDLDKEGLPLTVRSVFILDPEMKIRMILTYPATTGRNFVELLRVVDSIQMTSGKGVATPANWKAGEKTCVLPSVSPEEAEKKFPKGVQVVELPSGKPYLRMTADPSA